MARVYLHLTVLILFLSYASAYKYLAILHTAARSHFIISSALMRGLARKGHDVTVISPFPQKETIENYHDIPTPSIMEIMQKNKNNLFDQAKRSPIENHIRLHQMGLRMSESVLSEPAVATLLKSNQTFDAIICEVFVSESLFGFAQHFNAPLIGLGTFGASVWNTDMVGSPSPPSYVPNFMLQYTDHMPLPQRLANFGFLVFERLLQEFYYLPKQEKLYNKYFPNAKQSFYDMRKNTALVLLNSHVSIGFSRPYVPNQIEVGGLHIEHTPKPLPADIKKFIEESKHGVIYFSMGSNLQSKNMPLEIRQALLNTFRGLKQRVLWKFEESNLPGKSDNVFISDWFPQADILAHKNVILFITHGGLLSTTETIYHGKPVIGIPVFGDQFLNMANAERKGYGIKVDYQTLSAEKLSAAIHRILGDQSYSNRALEISKRFNDRDMPPLEKAIYWIEHVVRQKGADYLHCAGQDLNFWQYHSLDVFAIYLLILVVIVGLLIKVTRAIIHLFLSLFVSKRIKKQKKN